MREINNIVTKGLGTKTVRTHTVRKKPYVQIL